MLELIKAGGILMLPILICSVMAMAIIGERLWALQRARVLPPKLPEQVRQIVREKRLGEEVFRTLAGSPLGRVLAAGLANRMQSREVMKEAVEDVGHHVQHELSRYLPALGTIAAISPLLGLLGTVFGMISVFASISTVGVGNAGELAGGISQALITTAAGLVVAIGAIICHRFLRSRVTDYVLEMEKESLRLVDIILQQRNTSEPPRARAGSGAA